MHRFSSRGANRVVLKIKSLCLSANPAGWQRGLAHHMPNSPLAPCKYHKMSTGFSACACVCFSVCVCVSKRVSSIHTSVCSLIYYLPLVFSLPLFSPVACLSSAAGFPNVKWQQRGRQRAWRTFLMEGLLYFNEPSSSSSSPARFASMRREEEETDGGEKYK